MSDGSSTDNVRPKDDNGNDLNDDPVIREIDVEFDGAVSTIRKITRKKYAKNRQTGELVFKGNEDSYEIDGFPYKKTDFLKWLAERRVAEATNFCLNPKVFIGLMTSNTVKARKALLELSGYSAEEFAKTHPEFADITDALKGHTPDELKRVLNSSMKSIASDIEALTGSIRSLNALVDGDFESGKIDTAPFTKELEELQSAYEAEKEKLAEVQKNAVDVSPLRRNLHEAVEKANAELIAVRAEKTKQRSDINGRFADIKRELTYMVSAFNTMKKQAEATVEDVKSIDASIDRLLAQKFDASGKVCPTCGQSLPKEQIEESARVFERQISSAVEKLKKNSAGTKEACQYYKNEMKKLQKDYKSKQKEFHDVSDELTDITAEIDALPDMKSEDDIPEAVAIKKQIEKALATQELIDAMNDTLRSLDNSIFTAERNLKSAEMENEMKKKQFQTDFQKLEQAKKDMERKQAEYGQLMAKLDRLKEYSMASNKCLNDYVNGYFDHFKFSLFGETQSGDTYETCQMLVDGIPYGNGLNHGDMILCEIDLARGFQKMVGVNLPIFVDDSESLDMDRIPKIENQLIILRRTDDTELKVTYGTD